MTSNICSFRENLPSLSLMVMWSNFSILNTMNSQSKDFFKIPKSRFAQLRKAQGAFVEYKIIEKRLIT